MYKIIFELFFFQSLKLNKRVKLKKKNKQNNINNDQKRYAYNI